MKSSASSPACFRLFIFSCSLILVLSACSTNIKNIATNTTDPSNLSDAEPSIAINPLNPKEIAVVTFSEGWNATTGAPVWKSVDGGTTWSKQFILPSPNVNSSGPGDQKVQFDRNGNLLIAELIGGISVIPRCLVFRQTGAINTPLTFGALYGDDQPMLDIDKTSSSTFVDRLYSAWLSFPFGANHQSMVTRSTDLGVNTTDAAAGTSNAFSNRTTRSAVGIDGSVYIVYKTREGIVAGGFENAHFWVKRSDDGGATWNALGANGVSVHGAGQVQTWFTTQWGNPAKGLVGRARSSDAWIATDPSDGDIYVTYCHRDASGFGQIFVARSDDRGATWTTNRLTNGTRHSAYPEIAVADNGVVGVLYIDFDDSGPQTQFRHRFARSFDDAVTWARHETLQTMNTDGLTNAADGFLWGDYEGLAAHGYYFYGAFTGRSIGRTTAQLDPIFFKRVAFIKRRPVLNLCKVNPDLCRIAEIDKNLIKLKCHIKGCVIIDPLPRNCLYKFSCPGCSPSGKCPPPFYIFKFEELVDWNVRLIDPLGNTVKPELTRDGNNVILSFAPKEEFFKKGKVGNYQFVFTLKEQGVIGKDYNITTSLEASDVPFSQKR